mgnify:CR=1 FL=1
MQFVLIDTWWNVNYNQIYFADKIARFNRYMVECEFDLICERSEPSWSFNRYMVECEFLHSSGIFLLAKVLIDTWWNVNLRKL